MKLFAKKVSKSVSSKKKKSAETDLADYRPDESEPFMNERQKEYFRRKLLDWKADILRESKYTLEQLQEESLHLPISPIALRARPTRRLNCAPATASAS